MFRRIGTGPQIMWEADGGGGGGEPAPAEGAFDWSTVGATEEQMPSLQGKSPMDIFAEMQTQRNAATAREEKIRESILADETLTGQLVEKGGYIKKPEDHTAYSKSLIGDETKYEAPGDIEIDGDVFDAIAQNARNSGIHPDQLGEFLKGSEEALKEANAQHFEALDGKLKENWGDDYDKNQGFIDDYLTSLGDEALTRQKVIAALPMALQQDAANYLVERGKAMAEGNPGYQPGGGAQPGSGGDPEAEWKAIRAKGHEAGGVENLTKVEQEAYYRIYEAYKASKDAK